MGAMVARLVMAIISTLLEEAAIVVIVLWGLPQLEINLPLAVLIGIMVAWAIISALIYRSGTRALMMKPVAGLPGLIGSKGKVVNSLTPTGVVRIKSELWEAVSTDKEVKAGEEIVVVGQQDLKLMVRRANTRKRRRN